MRADDPGRASSGNCSERRADDERVAERTTRCPDARGRFGAYGGRYVPEVLIPALDELAAAWSELRDDPGFRDELGDLLARLRRAAHADHARAPAVRGARLRHLAEARGPRAHGRAQDQQRARPGADREAARQGADHRGDRRRPARRRRRRPRARCSACPCVVYMGEEDTHRQAPNVARMKLLGAEVVPVTAGTRTLKEAVNEALRDWAASGARTPTTSSARSSGPHPFPLLVRDLQRVIGDEARAQYAERIGARSRRRRRVRRRRHQRDRHVHGVRGRARRPADRRRGGRARDRSSASTARRSRRGSPGILHGALSYLLQDADGQVVETHSISAGLDYPGVGPEHAYLQGRRARRVRRARRTTQALAGFQALARTEGIIPALEPSHVIGWLLHAAAPGGCARARLPVGARRQGPRHGAGGARGEGRRR